MANGRLGSWDLSAGINQAIYVCNNDQATVLTLNIVNRNTVPADIRVAISTSGTDPSLAEYIEYDVTLLPKGVLERTGIVVGPQQYLIVKSDTARVNAVCWGIEVGDKIYSNFVIGNAGTTPTWTTASGSLGTLYAGKASSGEVDAISLVATDPYNAKLKYTVSSGSLPAGTVINENGVITSTAPVGGYTSGDAGQSTSFSVTASNGTNSSTRAFSITKIWNDGSTASRAAPNAASITATTGITTNGFYWINIPTVGAVQLYCDLSTDGGGWMRLAFAGSPSGQGDSNHIMFNQFGTVNTSRSYDATSFSRYDYARLLGGSKDSLSMWRRINDSNVILIHSMDEMWNRIPGGSRPTDRDMNGSGSGYPITTMRMSNSGPAGIVTKTNGRYESGTAYPGIAWNSSYNDNTDNVGSFTTYLNRRSIIYWETNGPQSNNQWFHADPLQLGPARGPTYGTSKHDIEVYFRP